MFSRGANISFSRYSKGTAPRAIIFVPIDSKELVSYQSVIRNAPLTALFFKLS